jgi:hypothetical protein
VRLKLRTLLRGIIEKIYLLTIRRGGRILCAAQVRFDGGKPREYVIDYRVAGHNRTGRWRVASFKNPWGVFHPESSGWIGLVPFDLGDPLGVERVEEILDGDYSEDWFKNSPWYPLPGEEGPAGRGVWPTPEPLAPSVFDYRGPLGYEDQPDRRCEAPPPSADADVRVELEWGGLADPEETLDLVLDHEIAERMMDFDRQHSDATPAERGQHAKWLRGVVLAEVASGQYRRESLARTPGAPAAHDADADGPFNDFMDWIEPVARRRLAGN